MLDGYSAYPLRHIEPDLADFLLAVHDPHHADIETEPFFIGNHLYQCRLSPVFIGLGVQPGVKVGLQSPEGLDLEFIISALGRGCRSPGDNQNNDGQCPVNVISPSVHNQKS